MENQYNKKHGTKPIVYSTGDNVYAKDFNLNQAFWVPGEIIECKGNVTYNVLMDFGSRKQLIRAHADQLCPKSYTEENSASNEYELSADILLKEIEMGKPTVDKELETPVQSPVPTIGLPGKITKRRRPVSTISRSP